MKKTAKAKRDGIVVIAQYLSTEAKKWCIQCKTTSKSSHHKNERLGIRSTHMV